MYYIINIYLYELIAIADPALASTETTPGIDTPGPHHCTLHAFGSQCLMRAANSSYAMPGKFS